MQKIFSSILAINIGSSSIKFGLFKAKKSLDQILKGSIDGIRLPEARLNIKFNNKPDCFLKVTYAHGGIALCKVGQKIAIPSS